MNDFRSLLHTLDSINEGNALDSTIEPVVKQYVKQGMDFNDLVRLERALRAAEPEKAGDDENPFSRLWSGAKRLASTESWRVKAGFAMAADMLGLPGLYDTGGKYFYYTDDEGNAASVGGASKSDAVRINDAGLLPDSIAKRFDLEPKATSARTYAVDDPDAPQADDEEDVDSADNSSSDPNVLELLDGSKFTKGNQQSERLARQKFARLLARYQTLVRKVNESVPVSMRGYLAEYNAVELLLEALTPAEQQELQTLYKDLTSLSNWKRDNGEEIIGKFNAEQLRRILARAPQAAIGSTQSSDEPEDDDAGSEDNMDDEANTGVTTSDSLEAFASSGKGGLKNDPDEVKAIEELQGILEDQGFNISVDGKYGPQTVAAVKEFQKIMGLTEDGDAGPNTINALLPFDNFIYGEEGGLVELHADLETLERLIQQGKGDQGDNTRAESTDFRSLINIVAQLNEALSNEDYEQLQQLRDKIRDGLEQLEAVGNVPRSFTQRVTVAVNDAGIDSLKPTGDADVDVGEPEPEPATDDEPFDIAEMDAEGIAQELEQAMVGIGTDEDAVYAALEKVKSKDVWDAVVRLYPAVYGDIEDDFSGDELTRVQQIINNFGGFFPGQIADTVEQLRDAVGGMGTDEEQFFAALDKIPNKSYWNAVVQQYPEIFDDIEGDFDEDELGIINQKLRRFGASLNARPSSRSNAPDDGSRGSQGPEDDVEAGVRSGGVAPQIRDDAEARSIINSLGNNQELVNQLSAEEREELRRLMGSGGR